MLRRGSSLTRAWRRSLSSSHFDAEYLGRRDANFTALSPTSLLLHAASSFPNKLAYVSGAGVVPEVDELKRTWGQVLKRALNTAYTLQHKFHLKPNQVVSVLAPNSHPIFELHFSVPGIRGVLHTINTRLDAKTIAFQLEHAECQVLFVDTEFSALANEALALLPQEVRRPRIVSINDPTFIPTPPSASASTSAASIKSLAAESEYEDLATQPAPATFSLQLPSDEWDAIALNYTSGTTGSPKGVVVHHRGAYLNAIQNIVESGLRKHCQYLWIVPLFHCNGWSFVWTLAANAGTSYFLRSIRPAPLLHIISRYKTDLFSGAPITMLTLLAYVDALKASASPADAATLAALKIPFSHDIKFTVAGAPPPPSLIASFSKTFGISVQTLYGLTESYGPISSHQPDDAWHGVPAVTSDKSIPLAPTSSEEHPDALLARCTWQSKGALLEEISVVNPETLERVPMDGSTTGEIVLRGNIIMKGYLKNKKASDSELRAGYFFTGDVGVLHPGNRIEIKDRSKDVIISGGENISSVDVETSLLNHPLILEAAVVAMPDAKWGEVPCAFVVLRPTASSRGQPPDDIKKELLSWSRQRMAGFQAPKAFVVMSELPKTSTGKVQKHALRSSLPGKV